MRSAPILDPALTAREPLPRGYAAARKAVALLLVAVFAAVLVVPLVLADFRGERQAASFENRFLSAFPRWSWKKKRLDAFPAQFTAAFNDRFGLRDTLLLWHHRLVWQCLGSSPIESVTVGREGWLFWSNSVREHCGIRKIGKSEVQRWHAVLTAKQAWLEARGVKYLLVIAPNKEEIYPEYLPPLMRRKGGGGFLDPILASLGGAVDLLDLRPLLLAAKPLGPVYDRTDTHWSSLGSFLVTNEVVRHLQPTFPRLRPAALSERGIGRETGPGGDLAHLLGFPAAIPEERAVVPRNPGLYRDGTPRFDAKWASLFSVTLVTDRQPPDGLPVVFISGDSFGNALMHYLPEFVGRAVRVWPGIPYPEAFQAALPALIDAEKPDLYIDILCERDLKTAPLGELKTSF